MKLSAQQSTLRQMKSDAVAVFTAEDKKIFSRQTNELKKVLKSQIEQLLDLEDFSGKANQIVVTYTDQKIAAPRIFLVGLGETKNLTLEKFRRASANAAKKGKALKIKRLAFHLPELPDGFSESAETVSQAIAEGAVLSLYTFDKYLTEKKDTKSTIEEIVVFDSLKAKVKQIKKGMGTAKVLCETVYLARDLENAPSNEIYPESLAATAKASAEKYGYRITIWNKKKIEEEGFGGLLGVNSGSARPPVFIILEYKRSNSPPLVLVGKGITFDTGGISIKPAANMAEMKMDMSGAAAVIGTMEAAARLKLPVHLIGLIPATENMPSGSAIKPGDIIKHYGGKTSEVDNTDAEGRLILADALAYAAKYKPAAVIDLATLTGACVVALGHHATGMMGNDSELMDKLKRAGEKTYERVWELPLFEEYEKQIKSDVADVKNTGGRWAGAITAGLFLKKFIGDYKWVHLDIAGTAILEEELPYAPKGGSGVGVRLLVEFLRIWKL
jgi:leucyl aminopeptidase